MHSAYYYCSNISGYILQKKPLWKAFSTPPGPIRTARLSARSI